VKNFSVSTVATAPVTPTAGTSLTVQSGHGVWFDVGMATVFPAGQMPNPSTGEVIRLGTPTGDTFPIVRAQESSTNRAIGVGDVIMQVPTAQWVDTAGGAFFNVRSKGAILDDTTDDTTAVQASITACAAAGGGTVLVPGKAYTPGGLTWPSNVTIMGIGPEASWLRKASGSSAILLDASGTATGYNTHNHMQRMYNISLKGSASTGTLLRAYYVDNMHLRGVYFHDSTGKMLDALELWDSYFHECTWLTGGGTGLQAPGSTTSAPMVHLRNGIAPSGFGSSTDNCNMVWFEQCRWEDFADGALWVELGANGVSNPNGIYVTQGKFETHRTRAIPIVTADQCSHIHFEDIDVVLGNFDTAGTPASTPVSAYLMGGYNAITVRDARFVVSDANSSMANGIEFYGAGNGAYAIDGITHEGLAPTNTVVQFGGTFGLTDVGTVYSTSATNLFGGAHPANMSVTFAATVTPDITAKAVVQRITLTGNITVGVPTHPFLGARLTMDLLQDATGGRTTTFNAVFKVAWTPTTTANKRNTITFEYDGTNWVQVATSIGL
jgi:hypothetical protein